MEQDNVKLLSHFSPVLPVDDIAKTLQWYNKLGFQVSFEWGDPVSYAIIGRDEIKIHLTKKEDDYKPSQVHTHLYIFVHDVEALHHEITSKGLAPSPIQSHDYGMRDFDLIDPNGYRLCFGMG